MEPLLVEGSRDRTRSRLWLVWGVGICLLALVLSLAWSRYQVQGDMLLADQLHAVEPVADFLAADTERLLYGTLQLFYAVEVMIEQVDPSESQSSKMQYNLLQLRQGQSYLDALMVLNAEGQVVHWSRETKAPVIPQQDFMKFYISQGGDDLQVGPPQLSPIDGESWVFPIYRALRSEDGAFQGMVVALVNLPRFVARYDGIELPAGALLALAASDGMIYFQLPGSDKHYGEQGRLPEAARQQENFPHSFSMTDPESDNRLLVATSKVGDHRLWAAMALSRDSVLSGWRGELPWVVMLLLLFSVLFVGGMVLISYQLRAGARSRSVLALQASTDVLTGSYNRRYLDVIAREQQRDREQDLLCCVCVMDIDLFKEINDQYGHVCGDEVLKRVAMALRDACRDSDILIRFGGDEFVLVLPQTAIGGAHVMAEKCRIAVAKLVMFGGGRRFKLSGSFGVSQWVSGEELDVALRRADAALYEAKKKGRDRVEIKEALLTIDERAPYPGE